MAIAQFPVVKAKSVHNLISEFGIEAVFKMIDDLPEYEAQNLYYDWEFWARDSQEMPAWAWRVWLLKSGRGAGKTRVGAETTRIKSDTEGRMHLIGRTAADVRDVMIEGESGILSISPPWNMPKYNPSKRILIWPNGSRALCFSADEPNLLRGPQCGFGWADEIASWRYLEETWNNFMFGLRLGRNPQAVATSTPRPVKLIKKLVAGDGKTVHVTTESTFANRQNLAASWFDEILEEYKGSRLALQELEGKVLDDNPLALWNTTTLDKYRVNKAPDLQQVVVGVDPSVSGDPTEMTSECGIVVAGRTGRKGASDSHGYVLDDMSLKANPSKWGEEAITAYHKYNADKIIAEANNGGSLVFNLLNAIDPSVPVELVHASRGKRTRAEPVSTLYDNGKVHHVGNFAELETQQVEWIPGDTSPDRLDALVWALTDLMIGPRKSRATSI